MLASDGMTCLWDRSGVHWCGAGSSMVKMRCGGATLGAAAGVCVALEGYRSTEGAQYTGSRCTLRDGARGAGETSGTAGGDRGPAAESKIVAIWRMVRSWSWTSVAKGEASNGLARASIKSQAARWASSEEDVWGLAQLWGEIRGYWRCVRRPWTVRRRSSRYSTWGLCRCNSRRRRDWPRCGSVGTKLGGRPRPLRGLDPSLVPEPRTRITVT